VSEQLAPAVPDIAVSAASAAAAAGNPSPRPDSYREILASTLLIGGSSLLTLAIGMVRTKAMALLLGPAGFGFMGVCNSLADLARSVAELGINSAGVRQIAAAAASGDATRVATTAIVLRRTALALGLLGALPLLLLAVPIAGLTFGNAGQATAVAVLAAAVYLRLWSDGQLALLQGLRRVDALARISVLGALLATLASLPLVGWLGQAGVAPAIVAMVAMSALLSWHYSRSVPLAPCRPTPAELRGEVRDLLALGLAFMISAVLMTAAAYGVRLIVSRQAGLDAAGLYQSAWTLGGLHVGFVLQAMGTDFYPRLVGLAHDHVPCNRLVNEQAHIGLLLAGPGVLATLTFAPQLITLLHSAEFGAAGDTLRWICLGMTLRVATWPLGFIVIAQARQTLFVLVEAAWTLVAVGLAWLLVGSYGVAGAGMAFLGAYVCHGLMLVPVARRLTGFRWSSANRRTGLLTLGAIVAVFTACQVLPPAWALSVGSVATVLSITCTLVAMVDLRRQGRGGRSGAPRPAPLEAGA
jgi:PST family polysaccharide transporter